MLRHERRVRLHLAFGRRRRYHCGSRSRVAGHDAHRVATRRPGDRCEPTEAHGILSFYFALFPGFAAQLSIAQNLSAMGKGDEALRTLQTMAAAHPERADVEIQIGEIYRSQRKWNDAVAAFKGYRKFQRLRFREDSRGHVKADALFDLMPGLRRGGRLRCLFLLRLRRRLRGTFSKRFELRHDVDR